MNPLDLLGVAGKILDKVIPDPKARAEAQAELLRIHQAGELAQIEVNKVEAAHGSLFVAGWRPGTGWICNAALGYQFLLRPLLITFGKPAPDLVIGDLLVILGGLLGLGGLRTKEKLAGVAAK